MEYLDVTFNEGPFSQEIKVENKSMAYLLIFLAVVGVGAFTYFKFRK